MSTTPNSIIDAVVQLQRSYLAYMSHLKTVLDFGDANIEPLIAALNHKHASPIAKALGLMMHSQAADKAFPILLDWLECQSPLYSGVLEALVRAGDRPATMVFERIEDAANKGDDAVVRNLFHLAHRFSAVQLPTVVELAISLLDNSDPDMRVTAADAIGWIGLPYGQPAIRKLQSMVRDDEKEFVRKTAKEALERLCAGATKKEN